MQLSDGLPKKIKRIIHGQLSVSVGPFCPSRALYFIDMGLTLFGKQRYAYDARRASERMP